ncbi:hypothetical protein VP1G_00015 [Cytospora mali]|uniref:Rhodopsin domain-containing protein n=1 Tax=Cytospora mali TaxID=578113 RepID=A0A194UM05_CYTMA|nr:hypothetical protein VP1G_00015 [Valsa mali var. pyri (nom. inval.)]
MASTGHGDVESNPRGSHQGSIIACAVITWLIAAIFVGMRLYLRGRVMKVMGLEDWVILASLIFSGCNSGGFITEVIYGLGLHAVDIPKDHWQPMAETAWFTVLFYTLTLCLTKVSILLLYKRTLTYDWTRITIGIFMTIVVLTSILDISVVVTACVPLNSFWDMSVKATYCHPHQVYYAIMGLQIGTDFLIFLLPLPVVWSMRAPRDQKVVLIAVFSFGFFICIVSIIRFIELAANLYNEDFTYTSVAVDYWSLIEVNTAIVCSCIMTLKPLLNRVIASSNGQDINAGAQPAAAQGLMHPPTIGSEPSKRFVARKQSWLTVQMARMDKSLQTVNEAGDTGDEVNLRTLGPPPPLHLTAARDRRSHNSSVITPIEQHADEGPLK